MKNRRLKKSVIYALYALSFIAVMSTIYLLENLTSSNMFDDDNIYVNEIILDNQYPVVSDKNIITKPYLDDNIKIVRNFYDKNASEEEQQNSLIDYQNTYLPNSGVDYKGDKAFDVVAVLDGKVTKISENNILGKTVEITHSNNMISVYQSLNNITVKEGEDILQGQVIAESGESNISIGLGNHLHFEIIYNNKNINPEKCYGKDIKDL